MQSATLPTNEINASNHIADFIDGKLVIRLQKGVPIEEFEQIWEGIRNLNCWEFTMVSDSDSPWTFWCAPFLEGRAPNESTAWRSHTPQWVRTLSECGLELAQNVLQQKLLIRRCFLNGHTFGQDGTIHQDKPDGARGVYTLVYYPCYEWPTEWEGETVFYEKDKCQIAKSFSYSPNTFLLWDSRLWHVGRAPSRICPELRVTLVWNLQVA